MKEDRLITEQTISELKKNRRNNLILFVVVFLIFAAVVTLSIIFATYETKALFCIIGSIVSSVIGAFLIYLVSKDIYVKNYIFRLEYIGKTDPNSIKGQVIQVSDEITLQNNDKVKEVIIANESGSYSCYLFSFVDFNFEIGKEYSLEVVDDFIKGVSYEN